MVENYAAIDQLRFKHYALEGEERLVSRKAPDTRKKTCDITLSEVEWRSCSAKSQSSCG